MSETTNLPTAPGWYWLRRHPLAAWGCCRLSDDGGAAGLRVQDGRNVPPLAHWQEEFPSAEWVGPLRPPGEPRPPEGGLAPGVARAVAPVWDAFAEATDALRGDALADVIDQLHDMLTRVRQSPDCLPEDNGGPTP